jgi:tetratricopeptide (TPR) repeat protein
MDEWLQQQIETARECLEEADESLTYGDIAGVRDAAEEALVILDMTESAPLEVRELRAKALNQIGLALQHAGNADEAREYHARAVDVVRDLDELRDDFRQSAAGIFLNSAQMELFEDNLQEAEDLNDRSLELLDALEEEDREIAPMLLLNVHQNRTMLAGASGRLDEAQESAERVVELAEDFAAKEIPSTLVQATQVCQQLSVQLFEAGYANDAVIKWAERAENLCERAHDHFGQEVLELYEVSQLNLVSYYEDARRFDDAEDALWKAIDVAGARDDIIQRGIAFYEHCRSQADKRLEKGGLPRDEVQMGYEDLKAMQEG